MSPWRTVAASSIALAGASAMLAGCAGSPAISEQPPAVRQDSSLSIAAPAWSVESDLPKGLAIGMQSDRVDELLGSPEVVMTAGRAQWWRYASGTCAIDVFMISDDPVARFTVSHVVVRSKPGQGPLADRPCQQMDARLDAQAHAEASLPDVRLP